jgi:hypothetical protein
VSFTIPDLLAKSASDDAIDEALGRLAVVLFSLGGETEESDQRRYTWPGLSCPSSTNLD